MDASADRCCKGEEQDKSSSGECDDWYSELERPKEFYSDAVKYWEVSAGGEF